MEDGCFELVFIILFGILAAAAIAVLAVVAGGAIAAMGLILGFGETAVRFSLRYVGGYWMRVTAPALAMTDSEPAAIGYFFGPGFLDVRAAVEEGEHGRGLAADRFGTEPPSEKGITKYALIAWNLGGSIGVVLGDLVGRAIFQLPVLVVLAVSGAGAFVGRTLIRLGQRGSALLRRVGYSCSNDGCSVRGQEPVYSCPTCGARHEQLWPNKYGVFMHSCTCGTNLPTLAVLGRRRLASSCRVCGGVLQGGETSDAHVVVVGAAGSGRTSVALSMVDALTVSGDGVSGLAPASPTELDAYRTIAQQGDHNSSRPRITVLSHVGEGLDSGHSVYIYDSPAEFDEAAAADQAFYDHVDAIALVVGAKQVLGITGQRGSANGLDSAPDLDELYARMLKTFDSHSGQSAAAIRASRMAVVVTGADKSVDAAIEGAAGTTADASQSSAIRAWLFSAGHGNFVRLLESDFKQVSYYLTTDMGGTSPDGVAYADVVGWLLDGRGFSKWRTA